MSGSDASGPSRGILDPACGLKGPVIPNVRAEQAAATALKELTDDLFVRVVKAEADRRRGRAEPN
jgi:hypothetical protein